MDVNRLVYQLQDGYIHHWLVAGPHARPVPALDRSREAEVDFKDRTRRQFFQEQAIMSETPIDHGTSEINGEKLTWNYVRCQQDHFIDVSSVNPTWQHVHTWAFTEIKAPAPGSVTLVLTACGPVDLWLNGKSIHLQEGFSSQPVSARLQVSLEKENWLLARFEQVAIGACENVLAVRMVGWSSPEAEKGVSICVPSKARYPLRHQAFEQMFEYAYLDEVVNHRGAQINLRWAEGVKEQVLYEYQIKDINHFVYVEGGWRTDPANPVNVGHIGRLRERPYYVTLKAPIKEFFEQNLRYERSLPFHVLDDPYSTAPYGSLAQRRLEALKSATKFEGNLFAEIAKMELNQWSDLDLAVIMDSIQAVNQGNLAKPVLLVGLLRILYRYRKNPSFPKKLRKPIQECAQNLIYWPDESGAELLEFRSESHAILTHTGAILAGQLYPERIFSHTRQSGQWHRARGEREALEWMRQRGGSGFIEWNSNDSYEQIILALTALTSLAIDETVRELAAVLLDKMLFMLAIHSFKGSFGSNHGYTHPTMIKSSQLEATSGITRLLWGMGVYNHHILGTVGLACSDYEYPAFFAELAADIPAEMWSKERHTRHAQGKESAGPAPVDVNLASYKTPDFMLSSAQDYRPGERGSQEHIWQATMGSEALVFTNHPACLSEHEAHRPGFWLGNAVLPRVAQWKDVLIAIYNFSADDWMGFTHAFFPIFAFDEHAFSGGWAFARQGQGYLALSCARGFELIKRGPDGYRELRSYGNRNVWICQMGNEAKDGSFTGFQSKRIETPLHFDDFAAQMTSLRGEKLSFGWQNPLMVNGIEQPITGFKHIENPYCTAEQNARTVDISYRDYLLRLNFE